MIIHWNPSPVFLSFGPLQVRWYGLAFLAGFTVSFRLLKALCHAEGRSAEKLDALLYLVVAGTVIGARLGHCFLYEPSYFLSHPLQVFAVWNGGLASHGGGLGVIIAIFIFWRRHREFKISFIMDRVAIFTSLTGGFIRLGNLMNSEIVGKPTGSGWGFVFDQIDQLPRHPTQIYESLSYFFIALVGAVIYALYRKRPPAFLLFGTILFLIFLSRFALEFFKENQEPFEAGMLLNMGQLLSIPFLVVGLVTVVWALRRAADDRAEGTE